MSQFKHVAGMGVATSLVIGGGAAAFSRGVARARAYQEAADAGAVRDDEIKAFDMLTRSFHAERARANKEKARADRLQKELDALRLEYARSLMG